MSKSLFSNAFDSFLNGAVVLTILQSISNYLCHYRYSFSESACSQILQISKQITATFEKPKDVIMKHAFETGSHRFCLRMGIELGLFKILERSKPYPVSAAALAKQSKCEHLLIVRIMRVITELGFATEEGVENYSSTALTAAICDPALEAGLVVCHEGSARVEMRMHEYFRQNGYTCPTDSSKGPFQWALNTDLAFFQYKESQPEQQRAFNTFMTGIRGTRTHWVDWFPVREHILTPALLRSEQEVCLVDVGGGVGHDIQRFLASYPECSGKLVLEDLQTTIDSIEQPSMDIRQVGHNFFTEQPIKGARAYFMHMILHDWPDNDCRKILLSLKSAMKPGHSRILINEAILPERNCPSFFACGDINMMAISAGMERTERQWTALIESTGLRVAKFWYSPLSDYDEGIIEVELPERRSE